MKNHPPSPKRGVTSRNRVTDALGETVEETEELITI